MREIVMIIMVSCLIDCLLLQIIANIQLCFEEDDDDEQDKL